MEEKKKSFKAWVIAHKKQLILAGISISVVLGIILGIKNKDSLEKLWAVLKSKIQNVPNAEMTVEPASQISTPQLKIVTVPHTYTRPQEPVNVGLHIRTLTGGRTHSAEKAAEALELGIDLLPNQTLVDPYTKYAA